VQQALEAEEARVQRLNSRIENLEMALQDSLRRTAEQEEALIHWQELAENSETRVQKLDEDLAKARAKLDTTGPLVEQLHRENEDRENDLARTREALEAAEARVMKLDAEVATARQQLEAIHRELGNEIGDGGEPQLEPVEALVELKEALDNASRRVLALEEERESLATRLEAYHERLLWAEAAQKEARTSATDAAQKLKVLARRYKQLEEAHQKEREQGARWKANVDRTLEMMYAAEKRVEEMREQLAAAEAEVAAKAERLQALQTALAERDEAYKRVMKSVTEREEREARLQESYEQKLKEKEDELAEVRQSVNLWLARRARADEQQKE
jgi:chromosome segregation ATPase